MVNYFVRGASAFLSVSAALLLGISQAEAHAQMVHAVPGPNASVSAPQMIEIHFNEALAARFSSFKVTDVDGAQVALKPMESKDPKALAAMPAAPLMPGLYTVSWAAAGGDGHPMTGKFSFTVK